MQCMHCTQSACRAVKIELKPGLILMRVPDAPQSALIIRMFLQSPLTALHASCMHCMQTCQDCECCLKSKSLSDMWLPDPYPMQGFLWKGGSSSNLTFKNVGPISSRRFPHSSFHKSFYPVTPRSMPWSWDHLGLHTIFLYSPGNSSGNCIWLQVSGLGACRTDRLS